MPVAEKDSVCEDLEADSRSSKGSTVTRVLDILESVASAEKALTPTEIADQLAIPKASVHSCAPRWSNTGISRRGSMAEACRLVIDSITWL